MKYVILAAGKGSRLAAQTEFKPLMPVLGTPLISYVIQAAEQLPVNEIIIVLGHKAVKLKTALQNLLKHHNVPITYVYNPQWKKENGFSLLAAKDYLTEPFILTMADHIADPAILHALVNTPLDPGHVVLGVDTTIIDNPYVDLEDVTKVYAIDGLIRQIGKYIPRFNAFDTGIFYCSEQIFKTMASVISATDLCSLSDLMQHLADLDRAKTMPVNGKFWIDVDDATMLQKTEQLLQTRLPW